MVVGGEENYMKRYIKIYASLISFICLFNLIGSGISVKAEVNSDYAREDFNKDGLINIIDLCVLVKSYNCNDASANWDKTYDLNNDGIIDLYDIVIVSKLIETDEYSDEEVYNLTVNATKELNTSIQRAYAIGGDEVTSTTISLIEQVGFYDFYENMKFTKSMVPDTSEVKVYYDRIYEIYDTINNNIIEYKETKNEACLSILKDKFDECEVLLKELKKMDSKYIYESILSILRSLVLIQESYKAKHDTDYLSDEYIYYIENLGFYDFYEEAKEIKNTVYLDESIKGYADKVYEICDSINSNIIEYKESNDELYLKLISDKFEEAKELLDECVK